ncbi:MAG: hypothetical protein EG828_03290 [Deltaproteobacteria bacterium]|nr:hypothetical protein [Deltaproteobacteria bacterium]
MSSDLLEIFKSLKGYSARRNYNNHHDYYAKNHDRFSENGHTYRNHGNHYFYGLACKVMRQLFGKILQNKRMALLVILGLLAAAAVFLVCAVWLVVTLFNLCGPLFSDIEKNGLKGVVDTVLKLVSRIWEGTGK